MSDAPPVPQASRILGLDLARAIAIFGMLTVNFRAKLTEEETPEWLLRLAEQVDGRAAALFVFLAGMGVALLTRKSRRSGDPAMLRADRWLLLRRALFLFVIGLAFRQIWDFDILHFYGVYLFAVAFLFAARERLVILAIAALILIFPLLYFVLPSQFGIPFWGTTESLHPREIAIDLFFQGYHPVAPWLAFLLAGMLVGRLELGDGRARRRMLLTGLLLVAVAEVLAQALLDFGLLKLAFALGPRESVEAAADLFGSDPYPPMPLFVMVGIGWALVVSSLCLSITGRWGQRAWLTPLIHTGQLALSVYILHGTVGVWAPGWLGYDAPQSLSWVLIYSVLFYALTILAATFWRRAFARGPVEAAMRWLTAPRSTLGKSA